MRILFILLESTMHERIGVMYLCAILKKKGYGVKLMLASRFTREQLEAEIREFAPHIIGYSAMTGEIQRLLELNRSLKPLFDFMAVFGGPHPTFSPEMIGEEGVDALCIGEGDLVFPEFCERVENKGPYWETANFVVKHEGKVITNPLVPLVEDLDQLPFPDREIMYEADPNLVENGRKMFFASRGCPYLCTYCFNSQYNEMYKGKGKIMRHRSPENMIEEILQVKAKYTLTDVWIDDDTFLIKPQGWIERFCTLLNERVGLPLDVNIRAGLVKEETIKILAKAGMNSVWMGVECGDEQVANTMLRRATSNKQIFKAVDILKRNGIDIVTQNLFGLPVPNSFENDLKTLDLNIQIAPTYAWSAILYPFPGTPVYNYAIEHGFLKKDEVFLLETTRRSSVLTFSDPKEARKIENLQKLFGLITRFPFLRRYTEFLCSLPLGGFYLALYYLWYGYCLKIKLYPFSSIRKELWKFTVLFFRMLRKS